MSYNYKVHADVILSYFYEVEAENRQEAIDMIQSGKLKPKRQKPVTSPVVTNIERGDKNVNQ